MGCPIFPFIDQGKHPGYMREGERERGKEKRKNQEEESLEAAPSFFSYRRVPPVV
jgi:hypothetical protein